MRATLLILTCATSLPIQASAQLIFSEPFGYGEGGIVTNSGGIWQSSSGMLHTMLVKENELDLTFLRAEDVVVRLPGGPYRVGGEVEELYTSFRIRFTALPSRTGSYFAHLSGESFLSHRGRIWAATTTVDGSSAAPGSFYIGIGNNTPSSNVPRAPGSGQVPIPLTTNVWYTIVTRYRINTAQASIWLDPASEWDRASMADDYVEPTEYIHATHLAFRQASGIGAMKIDDVRVGSTFASVAGANTSPLISSIPPQEIPADGCAGPLPFSVIDSETAAESLLVNASSSNKQVVPDDGLEISGTGGSRFITIRPLPGAEGHTRILIKVSDGVNEALTEFNVWVGYPSISEVADQVITGTNYPALVTFTVNDGETDAESLLVSVSSSNVLLLPAQGLILGGAGINRTLRLCPAENQHGGTLVTLTVSDGVNEVSTSFNVTVGLALGLLIDERFEYSEFQKPNSLYSAAGSPWINTSGQLNQVQVTNGWAYLSGSKSEDLALALPNGPYFPTDAVLFYTSFAVKCSELPTVSGSYFLHFRNSETGIAFRARLFTTTFGAGTDCYRLGIASSGNTFAAFPLDLKLQTIYRAVTRYDSLTGKAVLWVNPESEQSLFVEGIDAPSPEKVSHLALRQSTGMGSLAIAQLKVASSFMDVMGENSPAAERLAFRRIDEGMLLEWLNPAFSLSVSSDPFGPYSKIPGAQSPHFIGKGGERQFFRLVFP